jgi:hypothetical protein
VAGCLFDSHAVVHLDLLFYVSGWRWVELIASFVDGVQRVNDSQELTLFSKLAEHRETENELSPPGHSSCSRRSASHDGGVRTRGEDRKTYWNSTHGHGYERKHYDHGYRV